MDSTDNQLELTAATSAASEANASEAPTSEAPAATATSEEAGAGEAQDSSVIDPKLERKRLEEQLNALKRREAELRRALAIADHPDLADAVRAVEGACYAVTRVEAKMAQGLSKSEEKRRETLEKKLNQALEKRAELDAQIAEFRAELHALGEERTQAFEAERREGLLGLIASLSTHNAAFEAAGLEPSSLVPDLVRLMPEVQTLAETLVQARDAARASSN